MMNWDTAVGQRALARLNHEEVIWLTTISTSGIPQPRPVWFVWDGTTLLIYSMPTAKKLAHIAQNPNVALHFNTDVGGEDIQVFLGTAHLDPSAPPANLNAAYRSKYQDGIRALGMDEVQYAAMFSAALRVTPTRLRGLEPLPVVGGGWIL